MKSLRQVVGLDSALNLITSDNSGNDFTITLSVVPYQPNINRSWFNRRVINLHKVQSKSKYYNQIRFTSSIALKLTLNCYEITNGGKKVIFEK